MTEEEEESKGNVESSRSSKLILSTPLWMNLCMKLLCVLDPNVCIVDTDTTVHATPNQSAMIKKSEKECNDSVTMGNGHSEAPLWHGDFPVTLCDMGGNVKGY
jgi:hypothetical protein